MLTALLCGYISGFNYTTWIEDIHDSVGNLTALSRDILFEKFGLSKFLNTPACKLGEDSSLSQSSLNSKYRM